MKRLFSCILLAALTACTSIPNYKVDSQTHRATAYNERVRFIVIHYTAGGDESSIRALTGPHVSTHYLITSRGEEPIYKLLPEEKRGWHAGISEFQGRTNLNDSSVGVEIVNPGYRLEGEERRFYPYTEDQILKVVHLLRELSSRYKVDPTRIVGHSDIAPDRKHDPGPYFPWERLYKQHGIGAWFDDATYSRHLNQEEYEALTIEEIQELFSSYGYPMKVDGEWTEYNKKVVRAFQMHFRPAIYDGEMDLETYAIIKALNEKYVK